ncbi:MAG TPA: OadG family protein [Myxococcota bacterium]|nr:OadG family protein [Myxococcota bacterium]
MEHWLDLIAAGKAGYVTAFGMGGVFFALLCLYLFTLAMGTIIKIWRFRARHDEHASRPAASVASVQAAEANGEGEKIAAAVAVACVLQHRKRTAAVYTPDTGAGTHAGSSSAWRAAGRLDLMLPPTRRG